jgi:hypothetical protein
VNINFAPEPIQENELESKLKLLFNVRVQSLAVLKLSIFVLIA